MRVRRREWTWAVVAAVAAVLGLALDGRSTGVPRERVAPALGAAAAAGAAPECPVWTLLAGRGAVTGATAALFTDGLALLQTCPGAPRSVRLTGTTARGVGPWAVLETAEGVVFAGYVGPEGVDVGVDGPAWLAFTNDIVVGDEDRNLRATLR